MVVDSVNMLDGNVYLVSQGDNIQHKFRKRVIR